MLFLRDCRQNAVTEIKIHDAAFNANAVKDNSLSACGIRIISELSPPKKDAAARNTGFEYVCDSADVRLSRIQAMYVFNTTRTSMYISTTITENNFTAAGAGNLSV